MTPKLKSLLKKLTMLKKKKAELEKLYEKALKEEAAAEDKTLSIIESDEVSREETDKKAARDKTSPAQPSNIERELSGLSDEEINQLINETTGTTPKKKPAGRRNGEIG
jgi:hypothetical protein